MKFLLSTIVFLQARTPNNANVAASDPAYDTFGVAWYWFPIAIAVVLLLFYLAYRKGMLKFLGAWATPTKYVQTAPPKTPGDGPINV